jgi:hypothetical protein
MTPGTVGTLFFAPFLLFILFLPFFVLNLTEAHTFSLAPPTVTRDSPLFCSTLA